jgi:hypothetical protein
MVISPQTEDIEGGDGANGPHHAEGFPWSSIDRRQGVHGEALSLKLGQGAHQSIAV